MLFTMIPTINFVQNNSCSLSFFFLSASLMLSNNKQLLLLKYCAVILWLAAVKEFHRSVLYYFKLVIGEYIPHSYGKCDEG